MSELAPDYEAAPAREERAPHLALCPVCNGSGKVEGERAEWIRMGEEMRRDRESREATLISEAEARDLPLFLLVEMEQGLVRPVPREGLL